jgi:predicted MPP superfamily phosphohydrolase
VLGNHDYGLAEPDDEINQVRVRAVREALETIGVPLLHNEASVLTLPPNVQTPAADTGSALSLYIVGVGDDWANEAQPAVALAQVPNGAPRVVMMHNSDPFKAFPANTAPLAIAGHTHGGQVRIPWTPSWSWIGIVKEDEVQVDGWIDDFGEAGNHLYINRGIGFSIVPIRINCMPEVTLFTLQRGE